MITRFFRELSRSFCIYLLTALNLIHAIENQSFDWLLWASMALAGLSIVLNLITAIKGESNDGHA